MKLLSLSSTLVVSIGALTAMAQTAAPVDKSPASYDLKPQALQDLHLLHQRFADLAAAIPIEKLTWRPGEGVRSFSEVLLHVASLNFSMAPNFGAPAALGFVAKDYEKSTTDRAKIIAQVNQSFDYVEAALAKRSNDELRRIVKEFGPEASEGDIVYLIVADAHEHLGQAVAYARMNGIVPPWTAAQSIKP